MGAPPRHQPNEVLGGKFKIVREIGSGGMGAVYEVQHLITQHTRALKLLRVEGKQEEEASIRLLREASAAGRIGNPHIVETYDAGTLPNGDAYVIMELLEGESLSALLKRRGRVTVPELADLISQACAGLQAAHDAGIIHRDVKPANFFVIQRAGKSFLKVVDFGVSKFDSSATDETELTRDGAMIGTPGYMSPEQVRGVSDIDGRIDTYALGCIMYVALTGERPFGKGTVTEIALRIDRGSYVPLEKHRPDLPADLVAVVTKAMATEREDRFPSARDLGEALAPFLSDENVSDLRARLGVEGSVNVVIDRSALDSPTVTPSSRNSELSRKSSSSSHVRMDNPTGSLDGAPHSSGAPSITPPTYVHNPGAEEKPRTGETPVASEIAKAPPRRKSHTPMIVGMAAVAAVLGVTLGLLPRSPVPPPVTNAATDAVRTAEPLPSAAVAVALPLPSSKPAEPAPASTPPVVASAAAAVPSVVPSAHAGAGTTTITPGNHVPSKADGGVAQKRGVSVKDPTLLERSNPYGP